MSTEATPEVQPPASRNKLLIIIGAAIVVLLAIIAIAVSSQAIRAGQEADAKASAIAEESKMAAIAAAGEKALADQRAADAKEANEVCEKRLMERRPTAEIRTGTKSTYKASDSSYDTVGSYKDTKYPNTLPVQFKCSSIKQSAGTSNVYLLPEK